MTFISNEVNNKKYYEEIMYVSNNYYIFKKNPKTKVHSLIKVFILYIIILLIFTIMLLFVPTISGLAIITIIFCLLYIYLLVEAKYKLREYLKHGNSKITFDEEGVECTSEKEMSNKLYWDAIEYIIINKYSISILPKNFASVALFIEISSKDELIKALKKYKKEELLIDNSNKY